VGGLGESWLLSEAMWAVFGSLLLSISAVLTSVGGLEALGAFVLGGPMTPRPS